MEEKIREAINAALKGSHEIIFKFCEDLEKSKKAAIFLNDACNIGIIGMPIKDRLIMVAALSKEHSFYVSLISGFESNELINLFADNLSEGVESIEVVD